MHRTVNIMAVTADARSISTQFSSDKPHLYFISDAVAVIEKWAADGKRSSNAYDELVAAFVWDPAYGKIRQYNVIGLAVHLVSKYRW